MEIRKTDHYIEVSGSDFHGQFEIQILKDCSQLQMKTEDCCDFIDLNYEELKTIRDAITEVLDEYDKSRA